MKNISIPGKTGGIIFLTGVITIIIVQVFGQSLNLPIDKERANFVFFLLVFISGCFQLYGIYLENKTPSFREVIPYIIFIGIIIGAYVTKLL